MPIIPENKDDVDYDNAHLRRRKDDTFMFESISSSRDIPTWANFILKALGLVGVPSAIAMFLVYQNGMWGPKVEATELTTQTEMAQIRHELDQEGVKRDQMFRLLQRICINTAKTPEEKQRCFDQ